MTEITRRRGGAGFLATVETNASTRTAVETRASTSVAVKAGTVRRHGAIGPRVIDAATIFVARLSVAGLSVMALGVAGLGLGCGGGTNAARAESAAMHATRPPEDRDESARAIGAMIDDWHAAASAADEERYFGHFSEGAVFLGTDASERWSLAAFRAFAHPFFARGRAWSFRASRRAIEWGEDDDVAWFDEDLETPNLGPARGSGVVVRREGRWRIAHYNLALTIPNDKLDAVRAALGAATPPDTASESAD